MKNTELVLSTLGLLISISSSMAQTTLFWGGGTSDISDGSPRATSETALAGTWNTTTKNWSLDSAGTTYNTWTDGAQVILGPMLSPTTGGATITVADNFSPNIGSLFIGNITGSGSNQNFTFNNTAQLRTVNLTGSDVSFNVNQASPTTSSRGLVFTGNQAGTTGVALGGSANLLKLGPSYASILTPSSSFTGNVTINNGKINIGSASSGANDANLRGVSNFNIRPSLDNSLLLSNPTLTLNYRTNGQNNAVSDTANITLSGGTLEYRGQRNNTAANVGKETIGQLTLDGHGYLDLDTADATGSNSSVLTINNLSRATTRSTMTMLVDSTTSAPIATVSLPNWSGSTGTVVPWMQTNRAQLLRVNALKELEVVPMTDAPSDQATWTAGNDYRVVNAFTPTNSVPTVSINSLGLLTSGTAKTVTIGTGNTLTVSSGGVAYESTSTGDATITGGAITSGTDQLYLLTGANSGSRTLIVDSVISGAGMDVIKGGTGTLRLTGGASNTYTGVTYVNGGTLTLQKSSGFLAIPGDVVVENGGTLSHGGSNQIATSAKLTIKDGGNYNLGASAQTLSNTVTLSGGRITIVNGSLTLNGAGEGLVFNGGIIRQDSGGAGTLNLNTNVRYDSTATRQAQVQPKLGSAAFAFSLGSAARTFNIANSATLDAAVPEMVIGAPMTGASASVIKTGDGLLQFTNANTYGGGTTINQGTLQLSSVTAAAQSGIKGYTVNNYNALVFDAPVTGLVVGQTLTGSALGTRVIAAVTNPMEVVLTNTPATGTHTDIAALSVSRSGSVGSGAVTIGGGTFLVDNGITVTNAVTLNSGTFQNNGNYSGVLTLNGGTLKGSGSFSTALTFKSGSVHAPGNSPGLQTISNDLTYNSGSHFQFELAQDTEAGRGTVWDAVNMTAGNLTIDSGALFDVVLNGSGSSTDYTDAFWSADHTWLVLDFTGAGTSSGTFTLGTVSLDTLGQSGSGTFSLTNAGGDVVLNYTAVPEPSSVLLLATAATLFILRRRRSAV